jgi:Mrp family chromosome partitioning ATPase
MAAHESRPHAHAHHPDPVLITLTEPKSAASEAFRTLRTNIQFAGLDQPCRTIVVTSAGPEEGKTTSAANFGVVAAQAGSRVCVVDSDLRRPTLHRLFKLSNARGLTTALVEGLSFAEVAQPTMVPNLSILPSGPLPPNPAELVGSHRMRECLHAALRRGDLRDPGGQDGPRRPSARRRSDRNGQGEDPGRRPEPGGSAARRVLLLLSSVPTLLRSR